MLKPSPATIAKNTTDRIETPEGSKFVRRFTLSRAIAESNDPQLSIMNIIEKSGWRRVDSRSHSFEGHDHIAYLNFGENDEFADLYINGTSCIIWHNLESPFVEMKGEVERTVLFLSAQRKKEEVEELKRAWLADPCFEITGCEGFEAHNEELAQFRDGWEKTWNERSVEKKKLKMKEFGISPFDPDRLFGSMNSMQDQLEKLAERIEEIEYRNTKS